MRHHVNTERLVLLAGGMMLLGVTFITYFGAVRKAAEAGRELSAFEHVAHFCVGIGAGILSIVAVFLVMCVLGFTALGLMSLAQWVRDR